MRNQFAQSLFLALTLACILRHKSQANFGIPSEIEIMRSTLSEKATELKPHSRMNAWFEALAQGGSFPRCL